MITRNINDDNTLAYLFNGSSKAIKKTDKKVDDTGKKLDETTERLDETTERLDGDISDLSDTLGGRIDDLNDRVDGLTADDVGAMSKWVLLWSNASPMSEFAAQTITLDLSGYQFVKIGFKWYVGDAATPTIWQDFKVGVTGRAFRTEVKAYVNNRLVTVSTSSVAFAACIQSQGTGSTSNVNTALVPTEIYGIKGVA